MSIKYLMQKAHKLGCFYSVEILLENWLNMQSFKCCGDMTCYELSLAYKDDQDGSWILAMGRQKLVKSILKNNNLTHEHLLMHRLSLHYNNPTMTQYWIDHWLRTCGISEHDGTLDDHMDSHLLTCEQKDVLKFVKSLIK